MSTEALHLPIILDYAHACAWCPALAAAELVDVKSAKTRNHLQFLLDEAVRDKFTDVLVLASPVTADFVEKSVKRKKNLAGLQVRVEQVLSRTALASQAERLRELYRQHSTLLGKGFLYVSAHSMFVEDLRAFVTEHLKVAKKFSSLALTLLATPEACSETGTGHVLAFDGVSGDLCGFTTFDKHETADAAATAFRTADFAHENPRAIFLYDTDSGMVTSDLKLSFEHFVANQKLLEGLNANEDFVDVCAFVQDALSKSVELDGVRVHVMRERCSFRHSQVTNLRQLKRLLLVDSKAASDELDLKGNRSYWKACGLSDTPNESVRHESVEVPETCLLENVVLMRDVRIGQSVKLLKNCVVLPGAEIAVDCSDCLIEADARVTSFSAGTPAVIIHADGSTTAQDRRWFDEHLNTEPAFRALQQDPSKDEETFDNELYEIREEVQREQAHGVVGDDDGRTASDAHSPRLARDAEFEDEVADLLRCAEKGHMNDLIFELRTLRLSENKKNGDVMRAVAKVICDVLRTGGCNFKSSSAITALLESAELDQVVAAFCSDQLARFGFYEGVSGWCDDAVTQEALRGETFIAVVSSLQEFLVNEENLDAYLRSLDTAKSAALTKSPLIRAYLEWLNESDEETDQDKEAKRA